jgi:hypothetical protein
MLTSLASPDRAPAGPSRQEAATTPDPRQLSSHLQPRITNMSTRLRNREITIEPRQPRRVEKNPKIQNHDSVN